jgi:hypothetical protein
MGDNREREFRPLMLSPSLLERGSTGTDATRLIKRADAPSIALANLPCVGGSVWATDSHPTRASVSMTPVS